jgi:hypothetical protein
MVFLVEVPCDNIEIVWRFLLSREGGHTSNAIFALILLLMIGLPLQCEEWPAVKPVSQSFEVNFAAGLVAFDLPINSATGLVLYRLSCRGGSETVLDELGERDGVNWVGPFMCLLNQGNGPVSEDSLLAEDDSPPWHTRGQFTGSDLVGACGKYPEFGRNRSFRLRGFVLRLGVTNLVRGPEGSPRGFTLAVSVDRDPTARGAQAERPNYVQPRLGKCDVVREGRDPRMCRIWTGPTPGSWVPCPRQ